MSISVYETRVYVVAIHEAITTSN